MGRNAGYEKISVDRNIRHPSKYANIHRIHWSRQQAQALAI